LSNCISAGNSPNRNKTLLNTGITVNLNFKLKDKQTVGLKSILLSGVAKPIPNPGLKICELEKPDFAKNLHE